MGLPVRILWRVRRVMRVHFGVNVRNLLASIALGLFAWHTFSDEPSVECVLLQQLIIDPDLCKPDPIVCDCQG